MQNNNSTLNINLDVLKSNIKVLQSHLKAGSKLMAVVKANAYGHGLEAVAKAIAPKVDWFAVNDIHEAVVLRKANIKEPILVFGVPHKREADLYKQYDITATISAENHFSRLREGTKYHLNFDTGMGRLGFRPEELDKVLSLKKSYDALHCTGIYSHFATADESGSAQIEIQYQLFKKIRSYFNADVIVHMANTAASIQIPKAQFDMVRAGIGIYGFEPGDVEIDGLKPAITWATYLEQVKPIAESETVSYGATWQCPKDGYVGIIPVGYEDGIPRNLSNDFEVHINNKKYPVVGTVTMNYCMVYLGDDKLEEGTRVLLWDEDITARTWADKLGTIPYEVLTNLPHQILREYTDGKN